MMSDMAARLFILIALTIHALAGWNGAALAGLTEQRATGVAQSDEGACGESCCCPPKACPCLHAPDENGPEPTPVPPTRPDRPEVPKIAPSTRFPGASHSPEGSGAFWAVDRAVTGRPMGDLSRRVQQLQCVWRT